MEFEFLHGIYPVHGYGTMTSKGQQVPAVNYWEWDEVSLSNSGFMSGNMEHYHDKIVKTTTPDRRQMEKYLEMQCLLLGPHKFAKWLLDNGLITL